VGKCDICTKTGGEHIFEQEKTGKGIFKALNVSPKKINKDFYFRKNNCISH